ncbi:uncharacterized protein CLV47_1336 [Antricoccus suffuscus]|uniref:YncI copper-binding domain-containing protein n=1 Tax=Antricoccus suffuscus TaxID=1629062 RepID=A0A2T0YZG9_9ACTN|nr:YcnI family protein [Antricoccus suffuscus]PRZ29497.1 uncharacterized protein CLV47_1336 [Antricoccus suffuscus]
MRKKFSLRALTVLLATAAAVMAGAGAAFAHVTVSSPNAAKGGYATVAVKVPTESDTASTVGIKLQLPTDAPFKSVTIQPKAGWTYSVDKSGDTVSAITWTATGDGIKPGEFDTFNISVGPLPTDKDSVTFKAIQTYSDGTTVNWVEEASGSTEPEHPAPALTLSSAPATSAHGASASSAPATSASADSVDGLGVTGVILGGVGLLAGVAALVLVLTSRKRTAER